MSISTETCCRNGSSAGLGKCSFSVFRAPLWSAVFGATELIDMAVSDGALPLHHAYAA